MRRGSNITERVQDEQKKRTQRVGTDHIGHMGNSKTINPIIAILRDL